MNKEELKTLKLNTHVIRQYGQRFIKYHVAEYIGHTLTEPTRQIMPVFKLLPLDKTEPFKILNEFNCEKYEIL